MEVMQGGRMMENWATLTDEPGLTTGILYDFTSLANIVSDTAGIDCTLVKMAIGTMRYGCFGVEDYGYMTMARRGWVVWFDDGVERHRRILYCTE